MEVRIDVVDCGECPYFSGEGNSEVKTMRYWCAYSEKDLSPLTSEHEEFGIPDHCPFKAPKNKESSANSSPSVLLRDMLQWLVSFVDKNGLSNKVPTGMKVGIMCALDTDGSPFGSVNNRKPVTPKPCQACNGTGFHIVGNEPMNCQICNGVGTVSAVR